ncbi:toxin TcdB middle/N-terminal domain-containing protein, partial [Pelagibius sp.]|uniref:toxin TcdB middle/N-terminal domain-containing protein n=1 Tax=Pelagibius sp. TaxID=1931238 RepID=UPI002630058A
SEIRLWSLNRVTDSSGNAMTYHYIEDLADKSYRLDKIAYAYDAAVTTAKSEVRFLYEARPDIRTGYLAGAELAMTRRLTTIETWTDNGGGLALVKDYRIAYELSPATDRSRITAITECDATNNCLEPIVSGWQGQTLGYTYDLVRDTWGMSDAHWDATKRKIHIVDYNGDGLSDILLQGLQDTQDTILLTSNGSGFNYTEVTDSWGMTGSEWSATRKNLFVLDHNGDGLSDILLQGKTDSNGSVLLTSNGSSFDFSNVSTSWGMTGGHWDASKRRLHIVDVNGDGLTDLLLQGQIQTHASILLTNNGAGFDYSNITNSWGMTDGQWAADKRQIHLLDYQGDGLNDLLLQGQSGTEASVLLTHDGPTPDLLTSVTDSLGRVSTLTYAPLTDGTVYSKGGDAVFPVVDIQAPLYVVKSVSSDDGLGGQKVTAYDYAGAKVHVQGRGFRGFRQMTATDQQTGIVTATTYEQAFPYTAQVKGSAKTLADGTTVKTIDNTWDQLSLNAGATVYPYVATSVSEDYEINDGLGNLPVVSRSASAVFDNYGNPTSLTTTTSGGGETFTETVANTYTNDTTNWFLGLLTRSEVTRSRGATP